MSQEQLVEDQSENTQRHRNTRATLPDDRRSEIRTQNTVQHRRARSNVTTTVPSNDTTDEDLLNVFNPNPEQQQRIYKRYDFDIDSALKTFHHNAGAHLDRGVYPEGNQSQVINESKIDFEDIQKVNHAYHAHMNSANFKTCASCRCRNIEDTPRLVSVCQLTELELKSNERAVYNELCDDVRALQHVFHNDKNNKLYYLDPEFVSRNAETDDYEVYLCTKISNCYGHTMRKSGKKRPPVSLAGKYDYGRLPPWVKELSYLDCIIAGMYAPFHGAFKISSILDGKSWKSMKEARGHFIFLSHDGAANITNVNNATHQQQLPRTNVSDCMRIVFVGSRDLFASMTDNAAKKAQFIKSCGSALVVHPQNILKLIRLKKLQNDAGYAHVKLPDESSVEEGELINKLQQIPLELLELVEFVDDEKAMRTDAIVTSDIAAPSNRPINATVSNPTDPDIEGSTSDATTLADCNHQESFFSDDEREKIMTDHGEIISETLPEDLVIEDDTYTIPVKAIVIAPSVEKRAMNEADLVEAARNIVEGSKEPHPVRVFSGAINEFESNGLLLMTLFSSLFIRSDALKWQRGPLTHVEQMHMLLQVDGRFSSNVLFLHVLHDQKQRHSASLHSNITINTTNNEATKKFMEFINKEDVIGELDRAQTNPNAPESKKLLNLLSKVIHATGQNVAWSKSERLALKSDIFAMMLFYGTPSCFFTLSFADMDSMLVLRLAFVFPGDDHESFLNIPLPTVQERINLACKNPFDCAMAYKYMLEAVHEHLLQIKFDCNIKVARGPMTSLIISILGIVRAFVSVVEFQGRGTAHSHGLYFCSASPDLVRHAMSDPDLMKRLSEQLDSMVCAALPHEVLDSKSELNKSPVLSTHNCKEDTPLHRDHRNNAPLTSEADMMEKAYRIARQLQMHLHRPTCHKGKKGLLSCREGYGKALRDGDTSYVEVCFVTNEKGERQLRLLKEPSEKDRAGYDVIMDHQVNEVLLLELRRPSWNAMLASGNTNADTQTECDPECGAYIIDPVDEAGHKRYSNANVACFSPALSATLGCNHNVEFLGNRGQCIGACQYIVDYMTKDGNEPVSILSMAQQAVTNAKRFPSTAADAVSDERKRHSKLVLTKVLNQYSGMTEVSGEMAALHLLNFPSNQVSVSFTFAFTKPALAHVRNVHKSNPPEPTLDNTDARQFSDLGFTSHDDLNRGSPAVHNDATAVEEDLVDIMYDDEGDAEQDRLYWEMEGDEENLDPNAAGKQCMKIVSEEGGRHGLTDQLSCYIHRGAELQNVNYQEYVSIIATEKKPSTVATVRRPRRRSTNDEAEDATADQREVDGLPHMTCIRIHISIY